MGEEQAGDDDTRIKAMLEAGDLDDAVAEILRVYGMRIFRMMMGVLHDETMAQEVYQDFSISLWKSLETFRGESRVYTWSYTIAKRAIGQKLRGRSGREVRLHTHQEEQIQQWTRTATADWRKTEARDRFQKMCEDLDHDERTLVMLRIGEEMGWNDIAQVMNEGDPLEGDELKNTSARLRKQFQRVKEKLKSQLS